MQNREIFPTLEAIGYVQKTFGFNGQLSLQLDAKLLSPTDAPKFLWFMQSGKPVPYLLSEFKASSDQSLIVSFEDIEDEQTALSLKNLTAFVELKDYDKYFEATESYEYLMDFKVTDLHAGFIGVIADVLENHNGHDTLLVNFNDQEILIPFVDEIILKIDEKNRQISVDLPEGLLDLYLA